MIDALEGWIILEQDIIAIRYGQYKQQGGQIPGWYVGVVLKGMDKMVTTPILRTEVEMQTILGKVRAAWKAYAERSTPQEKETESTELARKMEERLEETNRMLEVMRRENERKEAEARKAAPKKAAKKTKAAAPFVPPTDEDIIRHILENGYDKTARQKPEGIARRFRRFYMRDGKTWRLANGKPMKDWKKAMSTWINNIDEDLEEQETGKPYIARPNAFTAFENQNDFDETLEEDLLRITAEDSDGNSPAAGTEPYLAGPAAG